MNFIVMFALWWNKIGSEVTLKTQGKISLKCTYWYVGIQRTVLPANKCDLNKRELNSIYEIMYTEKGNMQRKVICAEK